MLGTFSVHVWYILGTWVHDGYMLGTSFEHFGYMFCIFLGTWAHTWIMGYIVYMSTRVLLGTWVHLGV
jgi:hypothetical protein